jgi:hypothetical protein
VPTACFAQLACLFFHFLANIYRFDQTTKGGFWVVLASFPWAVHFSFSVGAALAWLIPFHSTASISGSGGLGVAIVRPDFCFEGIAVV